MAFEAIGAIGSLDELKSKDAASTNIQPQVQPQWNTFGQTNIWDEQKAAAAAHVI